MHEISLIQALFHQLEPELARWGPGRILAVHLAVGVAAGVHVPALELAFEACRDSVGLFRAQLKVTRVPLLLECSQCGQSSAPAWLTLACPHCGGLARLVEGQELKLTHLDLEE